MKRKIEKDMSTCTNGN